MDSRRIRPLLALIALTALLATALAASDVIRNALSERAGSSPPPSAAGGASSPPPSGSVRPTLAGNSPMPRITSRGRALYAGQERFQVWGFNYGIGDRYPILDYFEKPTARRRARVFKDMREARFLGANTLRVYLEIGSFMSNRDQPRPVALRAYRELLAEAQRLGLYIDVTGNLVWRKAPRWYDALGERARWRVQARFWRAVADAGHRSPAVLLYELTSEPHVTDSGSWYGGELGGYTFVQSIVRHIDGRDPQELARRWVRKMRNAIRAHDRRHLISIGFMPFCGGPFAHEKLLDLLDVLVVHMHPRGEDLDESIEKIRDFSAHRLPLVLGETSPIYSQSWSEFLLSIRSYVDGYLYYYDGRRPFELTGTSVSKIYMRAALRRFLGLRDELLGSPKSAPTAGSPNQEVASAGGRCRFAPRPS